MSIDFVNYSLEFRAGTTVGSCGSGVQVGANQQTIVSAIMVSGSAVQTGTSVPSGSCRVFSLIIRDLSDGSVLDSMNVTVDNV